MDNIALREQYEWSQIWWNNANDLSLPRVLLIGDSIACGYSGTVIELLQGCVNIDRLGNSKNIVDPAQAKETAYLLGEYTYAAIHFNNGLHGEHLSDDDYAAGLRRYVDLLHELGHGAQLIWASSTPVTCRDDPRTLNTAVNDCVLRRNAFAAQLMTELGIPIDDLYQVVIGQPDLRVADGYHYNEQGNRVLGQAVAGKLRDVLGCCAE